MLRGKILIKYISEIASPKRQGIQFITVFISHKSKQIKNNFFPILGIDFLNFLFTYFL